MGSCMKGEYVMEYYEEEELPTAQWVPHATQKERRTVPVLQSTVLACSGVVLALPGARHPRYLPSNRCSDICFFAEPSQLLEHFHSSSKGKVEKLW